MSVTGLTVLAAIPQLPPESLEEEALSSILRALDEVDARDFWQNRTICWNVPAALLAHRTSATAAGVRLRLGRRAADSVYPAGLTGAPLHLLLAEEAQDEIAWSVTNLWVTGVEDAGFPAPLVLLHEADAGRPALTGHYPEMDPPVIALARLAGTEVLAWFGPDGVRCLPLLRGTALSDASAKTGVREIDRARRRARRALENGSGAPGHIVVMTDLLEPGAGESFPRVLAAAEEWSSRSWTALRPLPDPTEWPRASRDVPPGIPHHPRSVSELVQAASMRKQRSSRINNRRILESMCGRTPRAAILPAARNERNFVASMTGEAALAGNGADAFFSAGHFCGFGSSLPGGAPPARSFVRSAVMPEPVLLETTTCFSFESDGSRGVRVVQGSGSGDAGWQLTTDYSFVGDVPVLIAGVALEGPEDAPTDAELLHLAVSTERMRSLTVETHHPDGSVGGIEWRQGGRQFASGSEVTVRFPSGPLTVGFLSREGTPFMGTVTFEEEPARITLGGTFRLSRPERGAPLSVFTLLLAAAEDGRSVLHGLMTRKLSPALLHELRRGPVMTARRAQEER